ncbi:TPA: type 4 pilus major pilin [Stenotrophomonas maltophilia]
METLLTLGAISALSLGIYKVLEPARANAQAKSEHDNLRNLSAAVERSWGVLGSFQGVSTQRVIDDALMPSHMFDGQAIRTKWGTSVSVVPRAVSSPGDASAIVYPLTPADVCSRLVTSVARTTYDVRIDGVSAFTADHPDPGAIAALCGKSNEATLEFVYHSGLVAGSVVAASPLVLPSVSAGVFPPVSGPVDGPVGPVGPVGPAGQVAPVAPAPVAPAPAPITPPPSSGTPVSPVTPRAGFTTAGTGQPSHLALGRLCGSCEPHDDRRPDARHLSCRATRASHRTARGNLQLQLSGSLGQAR